MTDLQSTTNNSQMDRSGHMTHMDNNGLPKELLFSKLSK